MKVFLMQEDGEQFCIRAETMNEAIKIGEELYLKECEDDGPGCNVDVERKYYHNDLLESCSLIGELKN